jgi:hydroxyacylglutathione hydrolase
MPLNIHQFPCLSDNYGFLVRDEASGAVACIDTPDPQRILAEAEALGWRITDIWNTHWHPDHAGGNLAVKAATGARVSGPAAEADRIPGLDLPLHGGEHLSLGDSVAEVIAAPGHTLGHILFHFQAEKRAFVGDTLFALGCGRLFEGTPAQMWAALSRIKTWEPETVLYCAHEYTASNARFALSVEPDHPDLRAYADWVSAQRTQGLPTVPIHLARECAANPFLRADEPTLQALLGHPGDSIASFAALRRAKDVFKS